MPESTPKAEKKSYKDTLNLPRTSFAMKANLIQNEPASLRRWDQMDLYRRLREQRRGAPRYVFHDGPPYANGSIHLGHLLNKVLKDLVVRSRTMMGFDCPYIPGWDCHGLPIEHKVVQELGDKARSMHALQIRQRCQADAEKFVKLQRQQMQRLLTLADYENPYLTMDPAYEAAVLEVFADLLSKGLVYRAKKPVHWSIANRTALAEAELEYYDREDHSIYVLFEAADPPAVFERFSVSPPASGAKPYFMIWTTTPWTLPANLAIAVHEGFDYSLVRFAGDRFAVVASELTEKVMRQAGVSDWEKLGPPLPGARLLELTYRHPFVQSPQHPFRVLPAPYVTLEDGTGLVHTAPGHGVEDYQTGQKHHLPTYCPVQEDGTFDHTAPQWLQGVEVWKANDLVIDRLRSSGHLFHDHKFTHSYPHDWRSKTPVIFRATEQWFIGVDRPFTLPGGTTSAGATSGGSGGDQPTTLRQLALRVTEHDVQFFPAWGRNRMRGMLESRPDWCISRQRAWGLPIPAFYTAQGDTLLTPASVRAVADATRHHGSDYWFKATPQELLATYDAVRDPDIPDALGQKIEAHGLQSAGLHKSTDIFDVWWESGTSWFAVIHQRRQAPDNGQTDLYLEGSDQHRGWFQSSLLPALGYMGRSPFRAVLTHGFMVDKDGRKMSKSLGNTLEVEALLKEFGADVCRWWVNSLNTDNDIKADLEFFRLAGEEYRKVRNTIRFLLSNLYDFDPRPRSAGGYRHEFTAADAATLDAWALAELAQLVRETRSDYEHFRFRKLHEAVFNFCNHTLSAVYLAAIKDRLYCDPAGSPRRRRTQTALYQITDALLRLIAPILPHTADEAWQSLHGASPRDMARCVHLELFPQPVEVPTDPDWPAVIRDYRDSALQQIELVRTGQGIDNPLDCGLRVVIDSTNAYLRRFDPIDLSDLCGISWVKLEPPPPEPPEALKTSGRDRYEVVDLRSEPRCERSWKRDGTVKSRRDGGLLCHRCAQALGLT